MPKVLAIQTQLVREHRLQIGAGGIGRHAEQLLFVPVDQCREVCNARFHVQQFGPQWVFQIDILRHLRTRTDDAHLPEKHVPKLGKLIHLVATEDGAKRSYTCVSIGG